MEYVTATSDMVSAIYHVLHTTIKTVYAKYYGSICAACLSEARLRIVYYGLPGN